MVCEHLEAVEAALLNRRITVTFRGQAWSENCREWVYFDAYIDTARAMKVFSLSPVVREHSHRGTHDGSEHGLVCTQCHDAIIGLLEPQAGKPVFPS